MDQLRSGAGTGSAAPMDAGALVAGLDAAVVQAGGLTPTLATADGQVLHFRNATELAGFALPAAERGGQATPALLQGYSQTVSWLDQTGHAFTQAAANLRVGAKAATDAGDAQQIGATAPGQRHALTQRVLLPDQFAADVAVSGDAGDRRSLAGLGATLVDLDPERPGLVQDALAQAGAANRDAGNPLLAVLDQVQERLDLARLRLPADVR